MSTKTDELMRLADEYAGALVVEVNEAHCWESTASATPARYVLAAAIQEVVAENTRLIEDRARFPDRPDDIGRMIGARFKNLEAVAKANEDAWRTASTRADLAERDAERYRWLRGGKARTTGTPRAGRIEVTCWESRGEGEILKGDALDAAIDAAMQPPESS